jgi:hypothetical protein
LTITYPDLDAPVDGTEPPSAWNELVLGAPSRVVDLLMSLASDPDRLHEAWEAYREAGGTMPASRFAAATGEFAGRPCVVCSDCDAPQWEADAVTNADGGQVCEGCAEDYTACDDCEKLHLDRDLYWVGSRQYCDPCRDVQCSYCEDCHEWYHDDDADEHRHYDFCDCVAPHSEFRFPASGGGAIADNERIEVELPAGVISLEGLNEIVAALWADPALPPHHRAVASSTVHGLDPRWQTRRGNFTRRLSAALHKQEIKLTPALLSVIGSVAKHHSSNAARWLVELTRDLNQPPEAFYNDESCWWSSHAFSRCALKNWGGLAMRSYDGAQDRSYCPNGRAWVQPLDASLRPTHGAEGAHAYLVYNCYGALEGYAGARIVAHLADRTYRKVACSLGEQFVNGNTAYLVADQATCDDVDHVEVYYDRHDRLDADGWGMRVAA